MIKIIAVLVALASLCISGYCLVSRAVIFRDLKKHQQEWDNIKRQIVLEACFSKYRSPYKTPTMQELGIAIYDWYFDYIKSLPTNFFGAKAIPRLGEIYYNPETLLDDLAEKETKLIQEDK